MLLDPLANEASYQAALNEVEQMMDREPELGSAEHDRCEVLIVLIQAYEAEHYPMHTSKPS